MSASSRRRVLGRLAGHRQGGNKGMAYYPEEHGFWEEAENASGQSLLLELAPLAPAMLAAYTRQAALQ